jgi:hypothetical protein
MPYASHETNDCPSCGWLALFNDMEQFGHSITIIFIFIPVLPNQARKKGLYIHSI